MAHREELPPRERRADLGAVPERTRRELTPQMERFYQEQAGKLGTALQNAGEDAGKAWKAVESKVDDTIKNLREACREEEAIVRDSSVPQYTRPPLRAEELRLFREEVASELLARVESVPSGINALMGGAEARKLYTKLFEVVQANASTRDSSAFIEAFRSGRGLDTAMEHLPLEVQDVVLDGFEGAELAQLRYAGVAGSARRVPAPKVTRITSMEAFYEAQADLYDKQLSRRAARTSRESAERILGERADQAITALKELRDKHEAAGISHTLEEVPSRKAALEEFRAKVMSGIAAYSRADAFMKLEKEAVEKSIGQLARKVRDNGGKKAYERFTKAFNGSPKNLEAIVKECGLNPDPKKAAQIADNILEGFSREELANMQIARHLEMKVKFPDATGVLGEARAAFREGADVVMRQNLGILFRVSAPVRAWVRYPRDAAARAAYMEELVERAARSTVTVRTVGGKILRGAVITAIVGAVGLVAYGVYRLFGGGGEEEKEEDKHTRPPQMRNIRPVDPVAAAFDGAANVYLSQLHNRTLFAKTIKRAPSVQKDPSLAVPIAAMLKSLPNPGKGKGAEDELHRSIQSLFLPGNEQSLQEMVDVLAALKPLLDARKETAYNLLVAAYMISRNVSGERFGNSGLSARLSFAKDLVAHVKKGGRIEDFLESPPAKYRKGAMTQEWSGRPLPGGDALGTLKQTEEVTRLRAELRALKLNEQKGAESVPRFLNNGELGALFSSFQAAYSVGTEPSSASVPKNYMQHVAGVRDLIKAGFTPARAGLVFELLSKVFDEKKWGESTRRMNLGPDMDKNQIREEIWRVAGEYPGWVRMGASREVTEETKSRFAPDVRIEEVFAVFDTKMSRRLRPEGEALMNAFADRWNTSDYPLMNSARAASLRDDIIVPLVRSRAFTRLKPADTAGLVFDLVTSFSGEYIESKKQASFTVAAVQGNRASNETIQMSPLHLMALGYLIEYAKGNKNAPIEELSAVKDMLVSLTDFPEAFAEGRENGPLSYISALMGSESFSHLSMAERVGLFRDFVSLVDSRVVVEKQVKRKKRRRTRTVRSLDYPMPRAVSAIEDYAGANANATVDGINSALAGYLAEHPEYSRQRK